MKNNVFDRNGFAALSDFNSQTWRDLYNELEEKQSEFLKKDLLFRSSEYKWPRDPLHSWSRIWEYPYVLYHIRKWRRSLSPANYKPVVVDLGAGVTFFPFVVARENCEVIGLDIDPVCVRDLNKAIEIFQPIIGSVSSRLIGENKIPLIDSGVDCVYSISVIEHVDEPINLIREIKRVLRPSGLFILTMDIALDKKGRLQVEEFYRLVGFLRDKFKQASLDFNVHPRDLLTSTNSFYKMGIGPWKEISCGLESFCGRLFGRDTRSLNMEILFRKAIRIILQAFGVRKHEVVKLACFGAVLYK